MLHYFITWKYSNFLWNYKYIILHYLVLSRQSLCDYLSSILLIIFSNSRKRKEYIIWRIHSNSVIWIISFFLLSLYPNSLCNCYMLGIVLCTTYIRIVISEQLERSLRLESDICYLLYIKIHFKNYRLITFTQFYSKIQSLFLYTLRKGLDERSE